MNDSVTRPARVDSVISLEDRLASGWW
jgi:hypothetical protein